MTSDSWAQALAAAKRKIKTCGESIDKATEAAARDPEGAAELRRYAVRKRLEIVDVAISVCDLYDRLAPRTHRLTNRELREYELELGLEEGEFWQNVREPVPGGTIRLRRGLELARELAEEELRSDPSTLKSDFGPAIIRVCCTTVVGALIGAPLGALAIHENVLNKMLEAAIVTGLSAVATEISGPLSTLMRRPADPAPRSLSGVDAIIDEILDLEGPRGGLRNPDDDDFPPDPDPPGSPWPDGPGRL